MIEVIYAEPETLSLEDDISSKASVSNVLLIADNVPSNRDFLLKDHYFQYAGFEQAIAILNSRSLSAILVFDTMVDKSSLQFNYVRSFAKREGIPFVLYSRKCTSTNLHTAIKSDFDDYYCGDLNDGCVRKIKFTQRLNAYRNSKLGGNTSFIGKPKAKDRTIKRAFDVLLSATVLILLAPVLGLIALIVKLESRGPVLYISKRAGAGYKIFDFYKIRTMTDGSDLNLQQLSDKNKYGNAVFYKIKNDPRITRFGRFLRATSLDELPQLINVLKGDMSLVGNRPLPLYEAEKLTRDGDAQRFFAPAGITGLWQVTKRSRKQLSERERINLDIHYANKSSFGYDLKILLSTFPAMMQTDEI